MALYPPPCFPPPFVSQLRLPAVLPPHIACPQRRPICVCPVRLCVAVDFLQLNNFDQIQFQIVENFVNNR
jgi:hypothetical protein